MGRRAASIARGDFKRGVEVHKWFFIESKNGTIDKADVFRKIYDSLIMLIELDIIPDFEYARKNINYMLVYNSDKYPRMPESKSREANYSYFFIDFIDGNRLITSHKSL